MQGSSLSLPQMASEMMLFEFLAFFLCVSISHITINLLASNSFLPNFLLPFNTDIYSPSILPKKKLHVLPSEYKKVHNFYNVDSH